jgi:hypothetical protein
VGERVDVHLPAGDHENRDTSEAVVALDDGNEFLVVYDQDGGEGVLGFMCREEALSSSSLWSDGRSVVLCRGFGGWPERLDRLLVELSSCPVVALCFGHERLACELFGDFYPPPDAGDGLFPRSRSDFCVITRGDGGF